MKIRNATTRVRLTWDGARDIHPGQVIDSETMQPGEAEWHLRHGCVRVDVPEPTPAPMTAPVEMPTDVVVRRTRRKRATKKRSSKRGG